MNGSRNPLDTIEQQLDLLDRALELGDIETIELPTWTPPVSHDPLDGDRLVVLLDRIELTIQRVGEAKQHVSEAQSALSRRREIARTYAAAQA